MLAPTIMHFKGGTGYKGENPLFAKYEAGMLGNMGYSSVQCTSVPMDLGKLNMQCPYGTVGKIFGYGINLSDATAQNCVEHDEIAQCKPDATNFVETGLQSVIGKSVHVIDYGKW